MKAKRYFLSLLAFVCMAAGSVSASGLGDIRVSARFLTDRMAFELNLNQTQYNDLFEVNFDFLTHVDPYAVAMARADARALDAYYRYLDERNDDLRWILSATAYTRFLALEYFFRPVYAYGGVCYLRIYKVYPNHSFFYFGPPVHYRTYCGAHSRIRCGGISFYRTHYRTRYPHPVYSGRFHSRPEHRKHDFRPVRPSANPGYHFTPMRPTRPAAPSHQPPHRPQTRPETHPSRPSRPAVSPSKPGKAPARPQTRPSRPSGRPQHSVAHPSKPAVRPSAPRANRRPSVSGRTERPSRPAVRPQRASRESTPARRL